MRLQEFDAFRPWERWTYPWEMESRDGILMEDVYDGEYPWNMNGIVYLCDFKRVKHAQGRMVNAIG